MYILLGKVQKINVALSSKLDDKITDTRNKLYDWLGNKVLSQCLLFVNYCEMFGHDINLNMYFEFCFILKNRIRWFQW